MLSLFIFGFSPKQNSSCLIAIRVESRTVRRRKVKLSGTGTPSRSSCFLMPTGVRIVRWRCERSSSFSTMWLAFRD